MTEPTLATADHLLMRRVCRDFCRRHPAAGPPAALLGEAWIAVNRALPHYDATKASRDHYLAVCIERALVETVRPVGLHPRAGPPTTPFVTEDQEGKERTVDIGAEDVEMAGAVAQLDLDKILPKLPDHQRDILRARFGLDGCSPATLDELGAEMGLSRLRVRQRVEEARAAAEDAVEGRASVVGHDEAVRVAAEPEPDPEIGAPVTAATVFAAIRREVTAELGTRPGDRTPERIFEATAYLLAEVEPDLFLALRRGVHRRRDKEGRAARAILDEIHDELWKQPPFMSDRVINLSLDAKYDDETGGKPAKGSVLRHLDDSERETARRQLDALANRLKVELEGEHWHGHRKDDDDDGNALAKLVAIEKTAKEALDAAFRPPDIEPIPEWSSRLRARWLQAHGMPIEAEPPDVTAMRERQIRFGPAVYREAQARVFRAVDAVIAKTIKEMMDERYSHEKMRREKLPVAPLHRPQEWAAMALLQLMGRPEPILWPDAEGLIKDLTREARQDEGETPL